MRERVMRFVGLASGPHPIAGQRCNCEVRVLSTGKTHARIAAIFAHNALAVPEWARLEDLEELNANEDQ
jgi:hypothetical protein